MMINFIWGLMIVSGCLYAALNGRIAVVNACIIQAAEQGTTLAFKLLGIMCWWLGLLKVAQAAGLTRLLTKILLPALLPLFSSVPKNHPAMEAVALTVSANLLGLGNAVTPLGLKAMRELQSLNNGGNRATPAMCTFLALCTTGFTIVPSTVIGLRAAAQSQSPEIVVGAIIMTSLLATLAALLLDGCCRLAVRLAGRR